MPTGDVAYISDGKYKLGIKLTWGGGVSYLEDLTDGDDSITNLLNDHDTGRLIQQSYYGTDSAPYKPAKYGENMWCYNPVQGGDQHGNRSKLVDFKITEDGKSIWVKCRPLDWAQKKSYAPSYMENTYNPFGWSYRGREPIYRLLRLHSQGRSPGTPRVLYDQLPFRLRFL